LARCCSPGNFCILSSSFFEAERELSAIIAITMLRSPEVVRKIKKPK